MLRSSTSSEDRVAGLGLLTVVPLLVWWAGWFPGIMSSDSVDQWGQVLLFDFQNSHPITHTSYLWLISLVWQSPGAVSLLQVVLLAVLLAVVARRLFQLGAREWMAVTTVWVIALLPMTAVTTIAIWKDVPFTLAMIWVFTELLLLARDRNSFWGHWFGPMRLGIAMGLMWALRANGKLTVIVFVAALAVSFRGERRGLVLVAGSVVVVGMFLPAALVWALPVTNQPIEPAQVYMPDVAAVLVHSPNALSNSDLILISAVAPLEVWTSQYECADSSPLMFHPEFDSSVIRANAAAYRKLVLRSLAVAPGTVAGHRWCAGEYLVSPFNPRGTYLHRPPFDIAPNDLELTRAPISDRAFATTLWLYKTVENPHVEWLTWRPAVYMLFGLLTYAAVMTRRRLRPLGWIGLLFVIHLGNVFVTSPSQEFRYAFGLYVLALASVPVWYLIADPSRADIAPDTKRPVVPSEI